MAEWETRDYVAAAAVGTALGVAAAFLLRPKRSRMDRIIAEIKPIRKRMNKGATRARDAVARGTGTAREASSDLASSARDVLGEFRDELVRNAISAQKEFASNVDRQVKGARKTLKRRARKLRA